MDVGEYAAEYGGEGVGFHVAVFVIWICFHLF